MEIGKPTPEDVAVQTERLLRSKHFRGPKLRDLLRFVVSEWKVDGGAQMNLKYICENVTHEPLTFEEEGQKWGYPKTRANLAHVRNRLRKHYEMDGYRDRVIIKLNPGSYTPVIAYNPVSTNIPELAPEVARLILRAKTAIDLRTLKGARRAVSYYSQIPLTGSNARQDANTFFIPLACAAILPSACSAIAPHIETVVQHIKRLGVEPWEATFVEACGEVCIRHDWRKALELLELAITASQGEARYLWWYTALLASVGRSEEAILLLAQAVEHFSRTNIATRTDLALLLIMAERFDEAEEHLQASLDFAQPDNPLMAAHFAMLYEAQDRLDEAIAPLAHLFRPGTSYGVHEPGREEEKDYGDGYMFLKGAFCLDPGTGWSDRRRVRNDRHPPGVQGKMSSKLLR